MKLILIFIFFPFCVFSQKIEGQIKDKSNQSLPGVYISWLNNPSSTVISDFEGKFKILKSVLISVFAIANPFYPR